ncbi:MAG: hypothetical protein R2828_14370 [Saprospiraceae bacterium]
MKYQVLPTIEANRIALKDSPKAPNRMEEITSCAVFTLKNGGAILIPFDSSTGAIFDKLEDCLSLIERGRIDEIRTGNFLETQKEEMLKIAKEYTKFISLLEEKIGRDFEVTTNVEYLKRLNRDLLKFGKQRIKESQEIQLSLGIYLGAILKKIVDGKWEVEEINKGSKYNYYIPFIRDSGGKTYLLWNKISASLSSNKKFDLIDFIRSSTFFGNIDISKDEIRKKPSSEMN